MRDKRTPKDVCGEASTDSQCGFFGCVALSNALNFGEDITPYLFTSCYLALFV